jgi:hypothetical protein
MQSKRRLVLRYLTLIVSKLHLLVMCEQTHVFVIRLIFHLGPTYLAHTLLMEGIYQTDSCHKKLTSFSWFTQVAKFKVFVIRPVFFPLPFSLGSSYMVHRLIMECACYSCVCYRTVASHYWLCSIYATFSYLGQFLYCYTT